MPDALEIHYLAIMVKVMVALYWLRIIIKFGLHSNALYSYVRKTFEYLPQIYLIT